MVYSDYSLQPFNTFGFDVKAKFFTAPQTTDELRQLLADTQFKRLPLLLLGGGSNILFCDDFEGLVIQPRITGIEKIAEDATFAYVRVGAGVVWDDFVAWAVQHHLGGAENLSLIPGHAGAAPVQNIGAYGTEVKDIIHQVDCLYMDTGEPQTIPANECAFGYRESIFKRQWKNKMAVTHVVFRLHLHPVLQTHYGNVAEELKQFPEVSLQTVRQAIINIRRKKLPDPAKTGNAGSFFKNPVVPQKIAARIIAKDPQMPTYPATGDCIKLPAGRLIEQAGWKGRRVGNVGVHEQQALVLVHYGGATGRDIVALAKAIQQSVYDMFNVRLEQEVNTIFSSL